LLVLYIDATTGGIGIQMLLAGAVGGLVTVKLFWSNIFDRIRGRKPEDEVDEPGEASNAQ
jgi:hypothetical protein